MIPWGSRRPGAVWIRPFLCTSLCRRLISTGMRRHSSTGPTCTIAGWLDRIFLSTWQRRSNLVARCPSRPAGADTRRRLNPVNLSPIQVNPEKQATTRKFQLSKLLGRPGPVCLATGLRIMNGLVAARVRVTGSPAAHRRWRSAAPSSCAIWATGRPGHNSDALSIESQDFPWCHYPGSLPVSGQ